MGNFYNRHIEFISNTRDTHPQTGESKPTTVVDMYIHDDRIVLWGWGWANTYRPNSMTLNELADTIVKLMKQKCSRITWSDGDKEPLAPDGPPDEWSRHVELTYNINEAQADNGEPNCSHIYVYNDRMILEEGEKVSTAFRGYGEKSIDAIANEMIEAYQKGGYTINQNHYRIAPPEKNDAEDMLTLQNTSHKMWG